MSRRAETACPRGWTIASAAALFATVNPANSDPSDFPRPGRATTLRSMAEFHDGRNSQQAGLRRHVWRRDRLPIGATGLSGFMGGAHRRTTCCVCVVDRFHETNRFQALGPLPPLPPTRIARGGEGSGVGGGAPYTEAAVPADGPPTPDHLPTASRGGEKIAAPAPGNSRRGSRAISI
jgi:hypothetical protein